MFKKAKASGIGACVEVDLDFKTASMCGPAGCVEVATNQGGVIAVRDSKLGEASPVLTYNTDEWNAFLSGVKGGEFDI